RRRTDDAVAHRGGEPTQQATAEELLHALRRVEEVQRVPGGWRVHDDQVVAAGRMQLVQALHRDVVMALDEAGGDVLVKGVDEDGVPSAIIRGVTTDEVVPRRLGVEHGRPELAPRLQTGIAEGRR